MAGQTIVPTDVGFSWERADAMLAGAVTGTSHADETRSRIYREAVDAVVLLMATAQATSASPRWRGLRREP